MRIMMAAATALLAMGLSGCGGSGSQQDAAAPSGGASSAVVAAPAIAAASPPADFGMCMSCHAVIAGMNGVGPSLYGVFGRKAGSAPGYAYSDQLKASGLVWDEANLDSWLTAPMTKVPGTKMGFAGIADAGRRKLIIDYLKTLK